MECREKGGEVTLVVLRLARMREKIRAWTLVLWEIYVNFVTYKVGELGVIASNNSAFQNDLSCV